MFILFWVLTYLLPTMYLSSNPSIAQTSPPMVTNNTSSNVCPKSVPDMAMMVPPSWGPIMGSIWKIFLNLILFINSSCAYCKTGESGDFSKSEAKYTFWNVFFTLSSWNYSEEEIIFKILSLTATKTGFGQFIVVLGGIHPLLQSGLSCTLHMPPDWHQPHPSSGIVIRFERQRLQSGRPTSHLYKVTRNKKQGQIFMRNNIFSKTCEI